jgi:hypothetical protein
MSNTFPHSSKRLQEVMTRNSAAREIVAGFATVMPTLTDVWQHIETALADSRDLAAEVARLSAELVAMRLDRANAFAAMRAAIGAERDGEPDPLSFLRDELEASQNAPDAPAGGNYG